MLNQNRPAGRGPLRRSSWGAVWLLALFWPLSLLPGRAGGQEAATDGSRSIESPASVGAVVFPHLYHVEELGLECADCHHETSALALSSPHPEYFEDFWIDCESCHQGEEVTQPQSCANCHANGSRVGDETLSAKVVIHRSCWACHEVGTGPEASGSCGFCHERVR